MNEAASVEPPEVKTRFATVDDAAFEKLLYEKDAKNTRRGTKSALQTFRCKVMVLIALDFPAFERPAKITS